MPSWPRRVRSPAISCARRSRRCPHTSSSNRSLGLTATGGSGVLDSAHLLVDPLGTLAGWWHELLTTHSADVPDVLAHLRDLVAHDSKAAVNGNIVPPIGGTGTGHRSVVGADRRSSHPRRLDGRRSPDTGA